MRNRNVHVQFWLNRKESEDFDKIVRRSGLSKEAYLRQLICGYRPQDAPSPDYYSMMRQLYAIGNSLNQIAATAHSLSFIDAPKYDRAVSEYRAAVKAITDAVLAPRRIG